MKICIISKYPPIEGGVSSTIYRLSKGLGELGHEIFVVSNSWEVEEQYREIIDDDEIYKLEPNNVHFFSTSPNKKISFIPYFNPYDVKLANLSIDIIRKYDPDIIFSDYLLPYGVSAFIAKHVTKKPFIVKHAGSDIGRLFNSEFLRTVFVEIFKSADKIITNKKNATMLSTFGIEYNKCTSLRGYNFLDPREFNPEIKPLDLSSYKNTSNLPVFTYFGKFEALKKSLSLINAASKIEDDFILLIITERGEKLKIIEKILREKNIEKKTIILPFQPPWKMSSIINASTCVVCPESEETPFLPSGTHHPKKIIESMLCGKCTIVGDGVYKKYKESNNKIENGLNTIVINPDNVDEFAEKMRQIIKNPDIAYEIGNNATETIVNDFEKELKSFIDICNQVTLQFR
jgi:glycosyltransferase involved in cell wall biosynthesis